MILSARTILERGILDPICQRTKFQGLTHGLGPAGYDVRAEFDADGSTQLLVMPPGAFRLISTVEHFTMPRNVMGIVHDKSTWARQGLAVQNTVIEPGWCGHLTLELSNHGEQDLHLPWGVGIAQVIFHYVDHHCESYDGKYHNQGRGPQGPR